MTPDPAARWRAGRPGHGRHRDWFDRLATASVRPLFAQGGALPRGWVVVRAHADGRDYPVPASPDRARADRRAALDEIARINAREGLYDGDDF